MMKTKHYITTVTIANAIDIEVELELPADYNGSYHDLKQIAVKEALNILRDRVLNHGEYDVDEVLLYDEDEIVHFNDVEEIIRFANENEDEDEEYIPLF